MTILRFLGTNALDIFEGKLLPLKLGYIGVVNRSQKDINGRTSISDALKKETEYFKTSPYKHIRDVMGTSFLQKKLNRELTTHIKAKLPSIKSSLLQKFNDLTKAANEMGFEKDGQDSTKAIIGHLNQFQSGLQTILEGRSLSVDSTEMSAGSQINACLYGQVHQLISSAVCEPDNDKLSMIIGNLSGLDCMVFPDQYAFRITVNKLIDNYADPILASVQAIKGILDKAIDQCIGQYLGHFIQFKELVNAKITAKTRQFEDETIEHLKTFLDVQKSFMNLKHPEFQLNLAFMSEADDDRAAKEKAENVVIKSDVGRGQAVIRYLTTGSKPYRDNPALIIIKTDQMYIYKDEKAYNQGKTQDVLVTELSGCKVQTSEARAGQSFFLFRTNLKPLFANEMGIELLFPDQQSGPLIKMLTSLGSASSDLSRKAPPPPAPSSLPSSPRIARKQTNAAHNETTHLLRKNIKSYMKIIHVQIMDLTVKYIVHQLIRKVKYLI